MRPLPKGGSTVLHMARGQVQVLHRALVLLCFSWGGWVGERESLAAPGAFAGTAAVRYDVAAEAIAWASLLGNNLENVTFTGRQL